MSTTEPLLNRRVLRGHTDSVNGCVFSNDGLYIITISDDHTVRVWSVVTAGCVCTIDVIGTNMSAYMPGWPDPCTSVATTNTRGYFVYIWDVHTKQRVHSIWHYHMVDYTEYSPDGSMLVVITNTIATLWYLRNLRTGTVSNTPLKHDTRIGIWAFSSNGTKLVTATRSVVTTWDSRTGDCLCVFRHDTYVEALSVDGSVYVTSDAAMVTVRELIDGNVVQELCKVTHPRSPIDCALSKDGSYLAIRSAEHDAVVTIWSTRTGECMCTLDRDAENAEHAEHAENAEHAEHAEHAENAEVTGIVFSPDNMHVIIITQVIEIWNMFSGKRWYTLPKSSWWWYGASNGRWMAFGLDDTTVCVSSGPLVQTKWLVVALADRRYFNRGLRLPPELWWLIFTEFM